jgi:WXG100 family type VII secretion target
MSDISIPYAALEDAAQAMKSKSQAFDAKMSDLERDLRKLIGEEKWKGGAQVAYTEVKAQWDKDMAQLNAMLNEVGVSVIQIKDGWQSTDGDMAKKFTS